MLILGEEGAEEQRHGEVGNQETEREEDLGRARGRLKKEVQEEPREVLEAHSVGLGNPT